MIFMGVVLIALGIFKYQEIAGIGFGAVGIGFLLMHGCLTH